MVSSWKMTGILAKPRYLYLRTEDQEGQGPLHGAGSWSPAPECLMHQSELGRYTAGSSSTTHICFCTWLNQSHIWFKYSWTCKYTGMDNSKSPLDQSVLGRFIAGSSLPVCTCVSCGSCIWYPMDSYPQGGSLIFTGELGRAIIFLLMVF